MKYLVTVHTGFCLNDEERETIEENLRDASYPKVIMGPFDTNEEAEAVYGKVYDIVVNDKRVKETPGEVWGNIICIPDAQDQIIQYDVDTTLNKFLEKYLS